MDVYIKSKVKNKKAAWEPIRQAVDMAQSR